jgi:hypothetical protein
MPLAEAVGKRWLREAVLYSHTEAPELTQIRHVATRRRAGL